MQIATGIVEPHTSETWDTIVIGGGIAGVSLAARLATDRTVCVFEKEAGLAQHTTGKSVATFIQSYGNGVIHALNAASLEFFTDGRSDNGEALAKPLPFMYAANADTLGHLRDIYDAAGPLARDMQFVDGAGAVEFSPLLRPEWTVGGLIDPHVFDIDVHALMQTFAAILRRCGGAIRTSTEVVAARREGDHWIITDGSGALYRARTVVDAAGAWADPVARLFGAAPRDIRPLRRSVFTLAIPEHLANSVVPMINAADESFYLKPETAQLLCSPADETPTVPADTRPDEFEIARALDAISEATVVDARYVRTTWAGLRSFAPDRIPVVGFDDRVEGFFWYAGPGGYGIQTSPALSELGAAIFRGDGARATDEFDVDSADISPNRASIVSTAGH
ncbi:MAG: hypothetical protein BGO26_11595 [Actinobacteria bacterium 69-20]|jgi:D-arginine dehydrogenase|nr:FAD-binding oxidoreductase [Actinomycetota bacterium]OJV26560.1 MAG: hypothetical protein BGO26_11595 [Actinobacteria bacterium 69-20]